MHSGTYRNRIVTFRLTEAEYAEMQLQAKQLGVHVSDLIRTSIKRNLNETKTSNPHASG